MIVQQTPHNTVRISTATTDTKFCEVLKNLAIWKDWDNTFLFDGIKFYSFELSREKAAEFLMNYSLGDYNAR